MLKKLATNNINISTVNEMLSEKKQTEVANILLLYDAYVLGVVFDAF